MITLKEKKMLLKMKSALGEDVIELRAEIDAEEAKLASESESRRNAFEGMFANLSKELNQLAIQDKKRTTEQQALVESLGQLFVKIAADPQVPQEVKEELARVEEPVVEPAVEQPKPANVVDAVVQHVKETTQPTSVFVQPDPPLVSKDIRAIQNKLKLLEGWVSKISMTGPGGGEVNLRWLDDVARETIAPGRYLTYDPTTKKFVFDEINTQEVAYNTTLVTEPTYTIQSGDYYVGVNYAGPVTITLPVTATSGRTIIIKDEDGDAETYPITVSGNVDNDPGGFILQINNGAIQLIYRNGWRII